MQYLLAIDLGTSGVKTVVYEENGKAVVSVIKEYPLYQPHNGWAEQDPREWWEGCVAAIRGVLAESRISSAAIAGVGFSGQMHGLVMVDQAGEVLGRSIIWCDGRTVAECEEVNEQLGEKTIFDLTANPFLPNFTASKVCWVRKHDPELWERCRYILLPKDYIRYRLTGVIASEVSDASGTNLLDVRNRVWSEQMLHALSIPPEYMPPLVGSSEIAGKISAEAARMTGLVEGIPVVAGAADNAAAAIGTGVVEKGKAFLTLGTSGVIFAHADTPSMDPKGRVHTFCSAVPGAYAVISCTLCAGGALQWLRDQFFAQEVLAAQGLQCDPYEILCAQAAKVPIGANRLLFLPYLMGERSPLLDPDARGVFFGLSCAHTRYDLMRAVMEGVVFSQRANYDVLREMGIEFSALLVTGGGGRSELWRQMLADVLECPVSPVRNPQGAALGAAILAGIGTGLYSGFSQACRVMVQEGDTQLPVPIQTAQYMPYYAQYQKLYPRLQAAFSELAAL